MNASSLFRHTISGLALAVLVGATAFGQTVTTVPVGAMIFSLPATTQLTGTYLALPLTNQAIFTGPVSSFNSTTITFSGTPFTAGSLAQSGSPYFARIATGVQAGRIVLILANTTNSITVDVTDHSSQTTNLDTSGFSLAAGDRIDVIIGDTLATLFGDNNIKPVLIVGASAPLSADSVSIYNKSLSKYDGYYFNTTSGYWRLTSVNANANNTVIYPQEGFVINQRAGRAALPIVITGDVPVGATLIKVTGSSTGALCSSTFPMPMTLSQLNIVNWTKSNSALSADTIGVYNPATSKSDAYYQKLDNTWRRVGDSVTDQSSFVIGAGQSFTVLKRAAVSAASSYFAFQMPYTL